jgi:uncharacterized cupredoxin-like copper-binding protein
VVRDCLLRAVSRLHSGRPGNLCDWLVPRRCANSSTERMGGVRKEGTMAVARLLLPILLLVSGCAGQREPLTPPAGPSPDLAGVDWSRAERVDVTLADFSFTPDHLQFDRGRPYVLHLENRGSGGHNFDAPAFFRAVALRGEGSSAEILASGGKVELAGGKAVDVYLVPQLAGTYPLECSHPLHSIFGMTGEIVIQ